MAERASLSWEDYDKQREIYFSLRRLDLQYHDIRYSAEQGEIGLFYRLQERGAIERLVTDEEIMRLITLPPTETRAWLRGQCIARFANNVASADWSRLHFHSPGSLYFGDFLLELLDPLGGTEAEMAPIWHQLSSPSDIIKHCKPSLRASMGDEIDERTKTNTAGESETQTGER